MIALNDQDEQLLRQLAKERNNGKKGAISEIVSLAIHEVAKKDHRQQAIERQIATMNKGFDLGLKNKKAYEERSDIYD